MRRSRAVAALGSAPAGQVLESAFARLVPRRFSGLLAIAVDEAGPYVWSTGSWTTLPAPGDPCTGPAPSGEPAPVFQIGSVTKVFTALLLARAVESGEVALDAPVDAALGIPLRVGGRPVTYRHLVTHRSGLPRVPRGMRRQVDMTDPYRTIDTARLREAAAAAGDRVGSGREASITYSNFGFAVLGLALAESLRTPWERALEERVLKPAGLTTTDVRPTAPRAVTRDRRGTPVQPWDLAAFAPAGGLWMSAVDLATWLLLLTDAVLPSAGVTDARSQVLEATRMTLVPQAKSVLAHVGMAWQLIERDGVAWHNGGVLGASSFVGLDMPHARAIGVFGMGNPTPALDRAAMRALTGR